MPGTTTNLSLATYNNSTDGSATFLSWELDMSGSSNSNMTKIDDYAGNVTVSINGLSGSASGSVTAINNLMNSISGSITTTSASLTTINTRFVKLDEFDGPGQADFTAIPQTYQHLVLIGITGVNWAADVFSLGCDFNGDAVSSNYLSTYWQNTITTVAYEAFSTRELGLIELGLTLGTTYANYGVPFIAIIPNYSVSGGFYKTAMGLSAAPFSTAKALAAIDGGYWRSTAAITRVRLFGFSNTSARYDFLTGTKITLYGWG